MISKDDVDAYRQQVYEAMIRLRGGESLNDEGRHELQDILKSFSDEELKFGMPFNTPEEMAQMLTEQYWLAKTFRDYDSMYCHTSPAGHS